MKTYIETHSYDGGFRTLLVPSGHRPRVLPAPDCVGLRSHEVELAENDYALEFASFQRGSHLVSWLGCFTRGTDLSFGDRGGYCGVGMWLVDVGLIHSVHLIRFLHSVTAKITEHNYPTSEIIGKLDVFVHGFPELGWCVPQAPTLSMTGAVLWEDSRDLQSTYVVIPDNQQSDFDIAGIDILRFGIGRSGGSRSRRVYILARNSKIYAREVERLEYKNALTYAEHVIHSAKAKTGDYSDSRERLLSRRSQNSTW
jgi:hypothetical protein